jgi:hypothetical protein
MRDGDDDEFHILPLFKLFIDSDAGAICYNVYIQTRIERLIPKEPFSFTAIYHLEALLQIH